MLPPDFRVRIRLHRAPTLGTFRAALLDLLPVRDIAAARSTAVIVPTRSAAALLQRTIEDRLEPGQAAVLPDLVTRHEWYEQLAARAVDPPALLPALDRDVLMEAAAHAAITDGATPPFHLRSALVGEMVALYDAIRRQRQTVAGFERLVLEPLAAEAESDADAGAERMLRQSRFLAAAFAGYERRRDALGAADEHTFRQWLPEATLARPYRTLLVAVADHPRDPNGLWSADFDVIARLPGLADVHVVATEGLLASGWLERLDQVLPGIETEPALDLRKTGPPTAALDEQAAARFDVPRLLVPAAPASAGGQPGADAAPYFASRDREEELRDVVRRIRAVHRDEAARVALTRIGVVFDRPLPYVYLSRDVFGQGGVPFEARDALPLGAEPPAAAVDLALSAVATGFTRGSLTALLSSPLLLFRPSDDDEPVTRADVAHLTAALEDSDHRGDADALERLAGSWLDGTGRSRFARWDPAGAARAARAGARAMRLLAPLAGKAPASRQLECLAGFLRACRRPVAHDDPLRARLLRAEQAIAGLIEGLAAAHRVHHDLLWSAADLSTDLRHHIERHTFTPETGEPGVQLVDAAAAPFGDFDALHLVGLVDGEWPRRQRRNIFYSQGLLTALGWPGEPADPIGPARAAFLDLLQSPARHVSVSTFTLEDDALVEPSSFLDDIGRAGLTPIALDVPPVRVFEDESLAAGSTLAGFRDAETARWAALRASRLPAWLPRFHGSAGPQRPRPRSVSALDLYGQCPFKFYARHVLRLPEQRDEQEGLTPLERGRLHHQVFEAIFAAWQARGRTAITPDVLDQARALALEVMESHLARLPAADAALERTRMVGSPVAAGLIDVVFRLEAERPTPVVERRLEHAIDGLYTFGGADGPRQIEVRGIADRIDLLADGTFRVFDYKSGRPGSMLQLAVYAVCVRQKLRGYRGRDWQLAEAAYISFRGDRTVVPLTSRREDIEAALADAERQVVQIAEAIAAGVFPPRPRTRSLCQYCAYATVCRKDYVDADAAAPAV